MQWSMIRNGIAALPDKTSFQNSKPRGCKRTVVEVRVGKGPWMTRIVKRQLQPSRLRPASVVRLRPLRRTFPSMEQRRPTPQIV